MSRRILIALSLLATVSGLVQLRGAMAAGSAAPQTDLDGEFEIDSDADLDADRRATPPAEASERRERTFPPPAAKATGAPVPRAADADEPEPTYPKPGEIPATDHATAPRRIPLTSFDRDECSACLTTTCEQQVAAGGEVADALHMIMCMRYVDDKRSCIDGIPLAQHSTGLPGLPSGGELNDATRALIDCSAGCPCWTKL